MSFGRMKTSRMIPVHKVAREIPAVKREVLPAFYALSGCDTTSFLAGVGKKTYNKWAGHPELTQTLSQIVSSTDGVKPEHIAVIASFVVSVYSSTCPYTTVDKARQFVFSRTSRGFEYLPRAAQIQHIKRTVVQAGLVWGQSLVPLQEKVNLKDWGWDLSDNGWVPY